MEQALNSAKGRSPVADIALRISAIRGKFHQLSGVCVVKQAPRNEGMCRTVQRDQYAKSDLGPSCSRGSFQLNVFVHPAIRVYLFFALAHCR